MGCVCCSLSSFISLVLHALERVTLCTVCAMLVCCILFTLLGVLVIGVGIGFHYCEVETSVEAMAQAAKQATEQKQNRRSGSPLQPSRENMVHSVNTAVKRGFARQLGRRDRAGARMPSNNNTINDMILGRNHSLLNGNLFVPNYTDTMLGVKRDGQNYINAAFRLNGIVKNYNHTPSREKRDPTLSRNHTYISLRHNIIDENILRKIISERNHVDNPRRFKRDLGVYPTIDEANDMILNVKNDVVLNAPNDTVLNVTKDSITYDFNVNEPLNTTEEKLEETAVVFASSDNATPNISITDALWLRQKCTLLNFFTRFLQF